MSWRVRSLLINRDLIKRSAFEEVPLEGYWDDELESGLGLYVFSMYDSFDAEDRFPLKTSSAILFNPSEDYDDLLDVERALKKIYNETNKLSINDIDIINLIVRGYTYREIGEILGISNMTIHDRFKRICTMIEKELGFDFTDFGFASNIANKYNLNSDEIKNLLKFMEST